jgi:outer membrane protein TolC
MFTRKLNHLLRALIFSTATVCLLPTISAQPTANAPLAEDVFPQLKPILEKALKQSSQMILRNIDIAQAEATKTQASSALLPNLSGSLSYMSSTSAISSNTSVSSRASGGFYSFNFYQPVFQWGALKAQADSAKIGVSIAEKNYAEAYRLLAISIRSQYTGLVLKKMDLRNAEFALKTSSANLAVEEEKLRTGRISPGDIISPRLSVDEATLARDRAEASLTQGIRYFCALAGVENLDAAAIPEDITLKGQYYDTPYAAPLLAKYTGVEVENTLQAQVYRDYITQADLTYKIAKYRLYPKIAFSASYSQVNQTSVGQNYVSQVGVNSQSVILAANWSIFDGFATRGAKVSALATKRSYERQLETYLQTAGDKAKDLERQLNFASRAMRLADTRRALQADAVRQERANLERGVGTQLKVDGATAASYQADLAAVSARADFLSKWAEFLSALNLDPAMQNLPARYLSHGK